MAIIQDRIFRQIYTPHGDDSAADHPVEQAWTALLHILFEAAEQAVAAAADQDDPQPG